MISTTLIAALEYDRHNLLAKAAREQMLGAALADAQVPLPAANDSTVRALMHRVTTSLATIPAIFAFRLRSRVA